MPVAKPLMTLALCFGLGLGLSPTLRAAHACSCADTDSWHLELEPITGDGEVAVEAAFWPGTAYFSADAEAGRLDLGGDDSLVLERTP
jgi:hypothetical protein